MTCGMIPIWSIKIPNSGAPGRRARTAGRENSEVKTTPKRSVLCRSFVSTRSCTRNETYAEHVPASQNDRLTREDKDEDCGCPIHDLENVSSFYRT